MSNDNYDSEDFCGRCEWYVPENFTKSEKGECKRHAPIPAVIPSGSDEAFKKLVTLWPTVDALDYCGEWTAKK